MKKLFYIVSLLLGLFLLVGCTSNEPPIKIVSVIKAGETEEGYIYNINLSDDSFYSFIVPFGVDGTNGKDGKDGIDGKDGSTPYIGENGNWWTDGTDLGIKAQGPKGSKGDKGADGIDGVDGNTPYIGLNGNWWVNGNDTGTKAQGPQGEVGPQGPKGKDAPGVIKEPEDYNIFIDGLYTSKDDVAMYIFFFNKLPDNYRKKNEVTGHISSYYTPENKLSIGGDIFTNYQEILPLKAGRIYYEADINYTGTNPRNAFRIVFSNDGLIFYTNDHYDSFVMFDVEDFTWKSF